MLNYSSFTVTLFWGFAQLNEPKSQPHRSRGRVDKSSEHRLGFALGTAPRAADALEGRALSMGGCGESRAGLHELEEAG